MCCGPFRCCAFLPLFVAALFFAALFLRCLPLLGVLQQWCPLCCYYCVWHWSSAHVCSTRNADGDLNVRLNQLDLPIGSQVGSQVGQLICDPIGSQVGSQVTPCFFIRCKIIEYHDGNFRCRGRCLILKSHGNFRCRGRCLILCRIIKNNGNFFVKITRRDQDCYIACLCRVDMAHNNLSWTQLITGRRFLTVGRAWLQTHHVNVQRSKRIDLC